MARSLGRTQTLNQIGRTESFTDVFSTPPGPSSASLLQHRESSAAVNNDDDDDEEEVQKTGSRIRIDIDGDDEWEDGTQPVDSEDVPMDEPPAQREQQPTQPAVVPRAPVFTPSSPSKLSVNTIATDNAQRFPSPIPTEPEDPDPEYIANQLAKSNIKTRDFAYCPPYSTVAPPPSAPSFDIVARHFASVPQRHNNTITDVAVPNINVASYPQDALPVPMTPEVFDPYKALSEFEYRLRQTPRTLPIPGKTLRRLVEVGWVTENEIESRCSDEDLNNLEEYDSRNRQRLLRLKALREQRAKDLGLDLPVVSEGEEDNFGFTSTGAYPYITLKFDSVPTFKERDELVTSVRPLCITIDRVVRMAMAMERERERDRLEAEEALRQRRLADEEKERLERERVEREVLLDEQDEEMRSASQDNLYPNAGPGPGIIRIPPTLQPPVEITAGTTTGNPRKRSPHEAWADDEDDDGSDDVEDLEVKRLRLARSQSETWYQQQARLEREAAQGEAQSTDPQQQSQQVQPSPRARPRRSPRSSRPPSRSPRGPTGGAGHARKRSSPPLLPQPQQQSQSPFSQPQSQKQQQQSSAFSQSQPQHSRSQSQPTAFIPPEIQYPAPLSTYDPNLYPDAASAIESQSQQSQGRHHPSHINSAFRTPVVDTPPASPSDDNEEGDGDGADGGDAGGNAEGKGKGKSVGGRGVGLTEDGEEDTRPNALKRSPKKGVKRGLTRGRTLVQIC